MKRDPVKLGSQLRQVVLDAIVENLIANGVEVLCGELDGVHAHLLARFPKRNVRRQMGWSKYHATRALKAHCNAVGFDLGLNEGEGIWGKRCGVTPIRSRDHQVQVVKYILKHQSSGAAIWVANEWRDRAPALLQWAKRRK